VPERRLLKTRKNMPQELKNGLLKEKQKLDNKLKKLEKLKLQIHSMSQLKPKLL